MDNAMNQADFIDQDGDPDGIGGPAEIKAQLLVGENTGSCEQPDEPPMDQAPQNKLKRPRPQSIDDIHMDPAAQAIVDRLTSKSNQREAELETWNAKLEVVNKRIEDEDKRAQAVPQEQRRGRPGSWGRSKEEITVWFLRDWQLRIRNSRPTNNLSKQRLMVIQGLNKQERKKKRFDRHPFKVLSKEEADDIDFHGTGTRGLSGIGELMAAPVDLAESLGEPTYGFDPLDPGGKVDCEYVIKIEDGPMFSVYAYKSTSLYDPTLPRPEEFWALRQICGFSIGGSCNDQGFCNDQHEILRWVSEILGFITSP
jgi:hypothetical protein